MAAIFFWVGISFLIGSIWVTSISHQLYLTGIIFIVLGVTIAFVQVVDKKIKK